jgi:RNA polymerase sigma-70 factor (ECF subfamily)
MTPCHDEICQHRDYLIRFARRRLGDAALAEDMVQDTLLAAIQGIDRFEAKASLRTWLTGILQRRIADGLRRRAREPRYAHETVEVGDDGDEAAADMPEPIDWRDPPRALAGRQLMRALGDCLRELPPLGARLFQLRDIDGLSHDEAAAAAGLDKRRAAVLLHRTRQALRSRLAVHALALGEAA